MKRLILALATALLAVSALADHVYRGFAEGDSDLYSYGPGDEQVIGMQPGVGDSVDIYGRFGQRNADLFPPTQRGGSSVDNPDRTLPEIYDGFRDDPDLQW
jgi:hypothetical protein